MRPRRILFTGGGSGGHVYPQLAVIEALQQLSTKTNHELILSYLGPRDAYTPLFTAQGVTTYGLLGGKLRRYLSVMNVIDIPKFLLTIVQALCLVWYLMPDVVFSKGGTGALPVVFAAWIYRIPVVIHESDITPGLTNAISSRFATRIGVSFKEAVSVFNPSMTAWTGHPMRLSMLPRAENTPARAKQQLGFVDTAPLILVLGGSLGSTRINDAVIAALAEIIPVAQVLHQVGPANYEDVAAVSRAALAEIPTATAAAHPYKAVPYIEDMALAITAADLVISRAGSSSIFEIAAFGKPAILVPLFESANDHQRLNAMAFANAGGGIVIEENNLFPHLLAKEVRDTLGNLSKLQAMATASAAFAKVDGATIIADELLRLS